MLVVVVGQSHEVVPFALQIHFTPKPRITLAGVVPLAFRLSARIFICLFGGGKIVLQPLRDILFAFAFRQRLTFRICRFEFGFYAVCLRAALVAPTFTAREGFFRDGDIMTAVLVKFACFLWHCWFSICFGILGKKKQKIKKKNKIKNLER